MAERTVYLDADRNDWRCRKIEVRASRWFATVTLDREGYVDSSRQRGGPDPSLPDAYVEAADRVADAATDRIWYGGYTGSFSWGGGPSQVTLVVPFPHIDAAVESLRSAEMDADYRALHELADALVLPVDDWLAPGERELVRGLDFEPPPAVFLRFLRAQAKRSGLKLNGRATAGSVWIRPTLSAAERLRLEFEPDSDKDADRLDRWTGHVDGENVRWRPWVGGREADLSRNATPVRFSRAKTVAGGRCPCGTTLRDPEQKADNHVAQHAQWAFGVRIPQNLIWPAELAVVTSQSAISWRKLTSEVGRLPQRENGYDFNSWSHLGEPEKTAENVRAFLLQADGHVVGYLMALDTSEHAHWDLTDESPCEGRDDTLRPRIELIWVADCYRRRGLGATLVQALAEDFGCQVADVSWSTPISEAGRRLARRVSPEGIWVS